MQFSSFSRTQKDYTITLYNSFPIKNVKTIKYYSDNAVGTFSKKEFRWSFDSEHWSDWESLNQSSIINIDTTNKYFLYLQIQYIKGTSDSDVSQFTLTYEEGPNISNAPSLVSIPVLNASTATPVKSVKVSSSSSTSSFTQFSNFLRVEDVSTILLYNEDPLENVSNIRYYSENLSGSFLKKEFRWSFNNEYWSNWEDLSQNAVTRINTKDKNTLYLQIRYTKSSNDSKVNQFTLHYRTSEMLMTTVSSESKSTNIIEQTSNDALTLNGKTGAYYLSRANHTGSQPIGTISGLQTKLSNIDTSINNVYSYTNSSFITSYTNPGNNRVITSIDSSSINAESNLLFDGSILNVIGEASISRNLYVNGNIGIGTNNLTSKLTIDGDASISGTITSPYIDGSLNALKIKDSNIDTSLNTLSTKIQNVDASISSIINNTERYTGLSIDAGLSDISTGSKGYKQIDFDCEIAGWTLLADTSGNIVINIRKSTYSEWPSTTSITGTEKPSLVSQIKNSSDAISTWNKILNKDDILEFYVESSDTVRKVWFFLKMKPRY